MKFLKNWYPSTGRKWVVGTLSYSLAGLVVLFCWLLIGDFAWQARERAVTPLAQVALKGFGVSDFWVGLLVGSVPFAMAMLLSPIVAYRSDRFRSRWGRRIPFLLLMTPAAVAGMLGIGFAPVLARWVDAELGAHSPGPGPVFLTIFSLFWVLFEVAAVIGNALFGALINDVVPREVIGRFFGLFRVVSLLAGVLFSYFVLGQAEARHMEIFVALAVIYGAGFGAMCLRVREGGYPPVEKASSEQEGPLAAAAHYLRHCFSHPFYLWVFAGWSLGNLAFNPFLTFSLFYARSVGVELDLYGKVGAVSLVLSLVISYPIGALADRIHPLRVAMGALALYVVVAGCAAIWSRTPSGFVVAFVAHGVIAGIYLTGTASIGQRLFPKASFAQFAAAAGIVNGLLFMAVPPVMGAILDASGHAYHLTFAAGSLIAVLALLSLGVVLRGYQSLGGDRAFRAPE